MPALCYSLLLVLSEPRTTVQVNAVVWKMATAHLTIALHQRTKNDWLKELTSLQESNFCEEEKHPPLQEVTFRTPCALFPTTRVP